MILPSTESPLVAAAKAEKARREKLRRRCIADLATFFREAWSTLEGEKRFEEDFQHRAMFMHAQIMVEEWYLAGLEAHEVEAKLDEWQRDGRPYVADYREHWERPVDEYYEVATEKEVRKIHGCGRGKFIQRTTDLVINIGPISLKSRIFMVVLLSWIWTWCPEFDGFFSSGTPSNVDRDSLACRDLVLSPWYRETFKVAWTIRADLERIAKWGIGIQREDGSWQGLGSRESRGAGGSVTGIHADGLFLDDPDDAAKIWSEAARRDIWIFCQALGNRLKDPRRPLRFYLQQNLHPEDLTSKLVAQGTPRLAIPVEFNPERRARLYTAPYRWRDHREAKGEILQPERNTAAFMASEQIRLGTHGKEAQYNCDPRSLDGGIVKRHWWRFYKTRGKILPKSGAWVSVEGEARGDLPRPSGCDTKIPAIARPARFGRTTMAVDLIFGAEDGDFADIKVWAAVGGDRFLLGHWRKQQGFEESLVAIVELDAEFPGCKKLIEKAANGWATIATLKSKLPAVIAQKPIGSKDARLAAIAPTVEAGNCYIPLGPEWVDEFVEELAGATGHDDQADTTSYAILDLNAGKRTDPDGGWSG
jgi:predicted phage terminase large subunit-like protein